MTARRIGSWATRRLNAARRWRDAHRRARPSLGGTEGPVTAPGVSRVRGPARAGRRIAVAAAAAIGAAAIAVSGAAAITGAQVDRGEIAYAESCALCHGPNGDDGFAPAVSGPRSLQYFDSVRVVYDYTRQTMPLSAPGSLSDQAYLDVVAYLLGTRGITPDGEELSAATLDTTPLDPPAGRELRVLTTEHIAPDPNLAHNLMDLELKIGGQTVACDFRRHYYATGGLTRWGFPTSEVLEERENAFTQYYQRGAVDCHQRGGAWLMERRLAWDYVGGGLGQSVDLGVEPDLLNPNPGTLVGPWGHKVSNVDVDGTQTGFLDFFEELGGVSAFGFPKSDARRDDDPRAVLNIPGATRGFIRQYFQSTVVEFHPGDPEPVKLRLLGDDLRDRTYPNRQWETYASFGPAAAVVIGAGYVPERTAPSV